MESSADFEGAGHQIARSDGLAALLRYPVLAPLVAFALPFAVYLRTLAPTVQPWDSAELTVAAYTLGIAHPTGYPTFLLLGHLFSRLPMGDVAFRLNVMSAVFAAATICLIYLVARRLFGQTYLALAAALLLAFSRFFWEAAVFAEVYTLHTFFVALLLLLLLPREQVGRPRRLAGAALVLGLSMGNHMTTALLAPGLAALALWPDPRRTIRLRTLILCGLCLLLGLSVYLYLAFRAEAATIPAVNGYWNENESFVPINLRSAEGLGWLLSNGESRGSFFAYDWMELLEELGRYGGRLSISFLAVGIPLGILGCYSLLRSHPREGAALLIIFLLNAAFIVSYKTVEKDPMFLPTYLVWALWIPAGLGWAGRLARGVRLSERMGAEPMRAGALGAFAAVALLVNYSPVDLSGDSKLYDDARLVMRQVEPGSVILGTHFFIGVLEYAQVVEQLRPDVQLRRIEPGGWLIAHTLKRLLWTRPVYWIGADVPRAASFSTMPVAGDTAYRLDPASPRPGTLTVHTEPEVPTTIVVDGVPRKIWHLHALDLPGGDYQLSLTDVPGFIGPTTVTIRTCVAACSQPTEQPIDQPITVRPGQRTEVTAAFGPASAVDIGTGSIPKGLLIISTSGSGAAGPTVYIDGRPADQWVTWVNLEPRTYLASFEDLPGLPHPCARAVEVNAGSTTVVEGDYRTGTCEVQHLGEALP